MFTNSYFTAGVCRERQREMLARAERQRLARGFQAQSGTAQPVEQPRRRLRRALRAAFA
jgi:hypothetical protein